MNRLESKSANDYEQEIRFLIDEGRFFNAYDLSVQALSSFPDNTLLTLLGALALVNSGAIKRASKLIELVKEQLETTDSRTQQLHELFHRCVDDVSHHNNLQKTDLKRLQLFASFAKSVQQFSQKTSDNKNINSLKVAAEVSYKIWEHNQQQSYLKLSKNLSLECFNLEGSITDGIRAALLSWIGQSDDAKDSAKNLARLVKKQIEQVIPDSEKNLGQEYLNLCLAQLFLSEYDEAVYSCQQAVIHLSGKYLQIVNMHKILCLLRDHELTIPLQLWEVIKPPVIVIFAGQAIDPPDCDEEFFPSYIEQQVAHDLSLKLDEINADIGYCSAACGSDLLFIEAMFDRGAEVNLILPFAESDFLQARVNYAGTKWERRFKNALKLADTVTWSTKDPYLNDDELFRYNNLLIEGGARLRAESLQTMPKLLVVMDYLASAFPGSAADFMDQWTDITSMYMIDLDDIRDKVKLDNHSLQNKELNSDNDSNISPADSNEITSNAMQMVKPRVIKSMLFADIVHYSKMKEEQLPAIFKFLGAIKEKIKAQAEHLDLIESWGDALYVAMSSTIDIADYAFAICSALEECDHEAYGLSFKPELRIMHPPNFQSDQDVLPEL